MKIGRTMLRLPVVILFMGCHLLLPSDAVTKDGSLDNADELKPNIIQAILKDTDVQKKRHDISGKTPPTIPSIKSTEDVSNNQLIDKQAKSDLHSKAHVQKEENILHTKQTTVPETDVQIRQNNAAEKFNRKKTGQKKKDTNKIRQKRPNLRNKKRRPLRVNNLRQLKRMKGKKKYRKRLDRQRLKKRLHKMIGKNIKSSPVRSSIKSESAQETRKQPIKGRMPNKHLTKKTKQNARRRNLRLLKRVKGKKRNRKRLTRQRQKNRLQKLSAKKSSVSGKQKNKPTKHPKKQPKNRRKPFNSNRRKQFRMLKRKPSRILQGRKMKKQDMKNVGIKNKNTKLKLPRNELKDTLESTLRNKMKQSRKRKKLVWLKAKNGKKTVKRMNKARARKKLRNRMQTRNLKNRRMSHSGRLSQRLKTKRNLKANKDKINKPKQTNNNGLQDGKVGETNKKSTQTIDVAKQRHGH